MKKVATRKTSNVERVVALIHIKMNVLPKENSAARVANQIILPKFVKRPKRRVIRRKEADQTGDKRNLFNRLKCKKVVIQNQTINICMQLIQDTHVQKLTSRLVETGRLGYSAVILRLASIACMSVRETPQLHPFTFTLVICCTFTFWRHVVKTGP